MIFKRFLLKNISLRQKILIIPSVIIIAAMILTGGMIVYNMLMLEHEELIINSVQTLTNMMSAISISDLPADAMMGLLSGDPTLADNLSERFGLAGIDDIYFTDAAGDVVYPAGSVLPADVNLLVSGDAAAQGQRSKIRFSDRAVFAYAL